MTNLQRTKAIATSNDKLLEELTWTIEMSEGEFTLLLAYCNYTHLRKRLLQQLRQQCPVKIREIRLKPYVKTLYTTIRKALGEEQPSALMVLGLESVKAIEEVLISANQVREEFRKNFHFPLVLWVNDKLLRLLIQLAPDVKSWSTTFNFTLANDELIDFLRHSADEVFAAVLAADQFVSKAEILDNLQQAKMKLALKKLQSRKVDLDPEIEASLEFCLGRDNYASGQIDIALDHYQKSLAFWCQEAENPEQQNPKSDPLTPPYSPLSWEVHRLRKGILLFHIGLCYCRQAEQHQKESQHYWQEAQEAFQQCIDSFEQVQRLDLVARFIGQLGEVLRRLEAWDELEALAQKSLKLHQEDGSLSSLAQDYSFLAEVALHRSQWQEARQLAEQALSTLNQATVPQQPQRGLYLLLLAQALQQLGQNQEAIDYLKKAKEETPPQLDPKLYVRILEELRSLYFDQKKYLKAFQMKQTQREIELKFRLRAFIGAGQLQPQFEPRDSQRKMIPMFAASGRQEDVEHLVNERIALPTYKLRDFQEINDPESRQESAPKAIATDNKRSPLTSSDRH
ncbi:MAG: tetratricopeptide repeat protein [Xenococcaceae cyanobacterium]